MNTTLCTPQKALASQPAWSFPARATLRPRLAGWLAAWWCRRREAALARAHWRALQGLDDSTRRDLGLAEGALPYGAAQAAVDIERCRW